MDSREKRPTGRNRYSSQIRELQDKIDRVRSARSFNTNYRVGPGGVAYMANAEGRRAPANTGSDTWA